MMKKLLVIFALSLFSCSSQIKISDEVYLNTKLIGKWRNVQMNDEIGNHKMETYTIRRIDGTFEDVIMYNILEKEHITRITGKWWVEKNKYYAKTDKHQKIIVSFFKIKKNKIYFETLINDKPSKYEEIKID